MENVSALLALLENSLMQQVLAKIVPLVLVLTSNS